MTMLTLRTTEQITFLASVFRIFVSLTAQYIIQITMRKTDRQLDFSERCNVYVI